MTAKSGKKTFEESMARLEEVVAGLEGGQMPLDDSIRAFEEGMKLVKDCEEQLRKAAGKIEQLVKDASGKVSKVPLGTEAKNENS